MRPTLVKRLEQVAALVVAAGLAIVSYWLFFSWAQGGRLRQQVRPAEPPATAPTSTAPAQKPQAAPTARPGP